MTNIQKGYNHLYHVMKDITYTSEFRATIMHIKNALELSIKYEENKIPDITTHQMRNLMRMLFDTSFKVSPRLFVVMMYTYYKKYNENNLSIDTNMENTIVDMLRMLNIDKQQQELISNVLYTVIWNALQVYQIYSD